MNKSELISKVAEETTTSENQVKKIIDKTIGIIISAVAAGDEVLIKGFGLFKLNRIKERTLRNIRNGKKIKVKAHKLPHFKVSETFKRIVNE